MVVLGHEVNQGKATLQSMVFEPRARVLHFAYGEGPATKLNPVRLELGPLKVEEGAPVLHIERTTHLADGTPIGGSRRGTISRASPAAPGWTASSPYQA